MQERSRATRFERALMRKAGTFVVATTLGIASPAFADAAADADVAVKGWLEAVSSPDEAVLGAALAPEFQILRSDGRGYDRSDYLATGRSRQERPPVAHDLIATEAGGVLVVRYQLDVEQTIDGGTVTGTAPRLTVFRKDGDRWLVVAHANFAPIKP